MERRPKDEIDLIFKNLGVITTQIIVERAKEKLIFFPIIRGLNL